MSTPGVLRVGLVGAGAIAQTWAQAFDQAEGVELAAVADVRLPLADAMAEPFGVPAFEDAATLAASGTCDAAVVCTPPAAHVDVGLTLLAAGLHAICEKPLAIDCAGAHKLVHAAVDAGVVLTMASKFRFVDDVMRARSIITSGLIGEPVLFSNTFVGSADMRARWNSDPALSGGGVVIDNGTHSADIARYLFGAVTEVMASEGVRVQALDVEDTARLLLRMHNGALGTVTLSWGVESAANTYLEVVGTGGVVRVGWSRSRFRHAGNPQWIDFGRGYDKVAAHARQLECLARTVDGTGELLVTPADALASVAVIEAAYDSIATRQWTAVDEACP